ncbi:MAG TPA: ribosome-associated translation inhibitor RaiA [Mycobacteriales bacterium]|nr:ribosome-associated translation inhibitor RaiA [Mycobacteriales bacterium]
MQTDTDAAVITETSSAVQINVTGRNVEVPDHYREHVADKLERLMRYDNKLFRINVELIHEPNPRQSHTCQRVELTCRSRGPVIRSEACAGDFYSALDKAVGKLEGRLRRAADRRRIHRGRRTPVSVAAATARLRGTVDGAASLIPQQRRGNSESVMARDWGSLDGTVRLDGELLEGADGIDHSFPGQVVREKEHTAKPMTLDQALFEMELVGHDFYLFSDVDTGRPSVVYRRKAYNYGVMSLEG